MYEVYFSITIGAKALTHSDNYRTFEPAMDSIFDFMKLMDSGEFLILHNGLEYRRFSLIEHELKEVQLN